MYFPAYEVCDLNPAWSGHIISFCDIISLIELCTRLRRIHQQKHRQAYIRTHDIAHFWKLIKEILKMCQRRVSDFKYHLHLGYYM